MSEAARRMGVDPRHVRRLCASQWERIAVATQCDGQWHVHIGAHPDLRRGATAPLRDDAEFRQLPHHVRTPATQQAQCVAAFRAAKSDEAGPLKHRLPALIAELNDRYPALRISRPTLYRWSREAGEPIDPMNLVDTRRLTKAELPGAGAGPGISAEAIEFFVEAYLHGRASIQVCHERTADFAAGHGYTWCATYHQARRLCRKLIDKQTELQHRDPAKYRSTCRPWIERDPESFAANECWVSDHRPLDVICYVDDPDAPGGRRHFRPSITVWVDWRTRVVLGWKLVETPNTASILAALKMALLSPLCAGPPRFAWIDNGRDFDSYTLQGVTKVKRRRSKTSPGEMSIEGEQTLFPGVFGLLHMEPHHAIPYQGQGKARCERVFATVAARFDVSCATYTGKDTTRKPEDLSMHIAAGRAPHFEDLKARMDNWFVGHNTTAAHSIEDLRDDGLGKLSREDAYRAWATPAVMPDRQTVEMICYRWPAPPSRKDGRQLGRRVGRNGVSVTIGGATVRFGQWEPAMASFKGTDRQVVVAYDPDDVNQLYVFDQHMALVTVAQRNQIVGRYADPLTEGQVKAEQRNRAAYEKAGKVRRKHREHEYLTTEEIAAMEAAKRPRPVEVKRQTNGNMRLVQTRLDEASKQAQKQTRTMKVAGGGSVEVDSPVAGLADPRDLYAPTDTGVTDRPMDSWIDDAAGASDTTDGPAPGVSWAD